MLLCIVPAYFRTIIEEMGNGEITDRQIIKERKFFRDLTKKDLCVQNVMAGLGADFEALLPREQLDRVGSEVLGSFLATGLR